MEEAERRIAAFRQRAWKQRSPCEFQQDRESLFELDKWKAAPHMHCSDQSDQSDQRRHSASEGGKRADQRLAQSRAAAAGFRGRCESGLAREKCLEQIRFGRRLGGPGRRKAPECRKELRADETFERDSLEESVIDDGEDSDSVPALRRERLAKDSIPVCFAAPRRDLPVFSKTRVSNAVVRRRDEDRTAEHQNSAGIGYSDDSSPPRACKRVRICSGAGRGGGRRRRGTREVQLQGARLQRRVDGDCAARFSEIVGELEASDCGLEEIEEGGRTTMKKLKAMCSRAIRENELLIDRIVQQDRALAEIRRQSQLIVEDLESGTEMRSRWKRSAIRGSDADHDRFDASLDARRNAFLVDGKERHCREP